MLDNYLSSEMTGCLGAWDTFEARVAARADEGVVLAYQGSCDGLVAAAYLLHTLRGNGVDVPRSRILWVPTEDHSYEQLRSFLRQQRPAFLISLGMPVQNAPEALDDMVNSVSQGMFVFDHHHASETPTRDHLVVLNPTPTMEQAQAKPMPSSLFGYLCAERAGRDVAPWLVGVALLDEGVEEQMNFFYEELSRLNDLPSPGMVGGAAGLRQTIYGRISRLLVSNFAGRESEHTALDLAQQVLRGQLPGPDELLDAAGERLARLANTVTTEVRRHIDTWRQRITAYLKDETFVKLEIPSELSVAGPVAAILQGHFPEKIIVTYTRRGASAQVELRGPKEGANLAAAVDEVAQTLPVHCYRGQATTASLTVAEENLLAILDGLSAKLDPNWEEDDED
jgi:hypothetical protein